MFFFSLRFGFFGFGIPLESLLPLLALDPDRLLRALARARVGVRPLAVHREAAPVPQALVADDLDLALDVLTLLAAEVALHLVVGVNVAPEPDDRVLGEVPHPGVHAHHGAVRDLPGPGGADPIDIGEADLEPLFPGEVDPGDARHQPCLCLWRGFVQITTIRPCRRTILHFSHIRLTLGFTFTFLASWFGGRPSRFICLSVSEDYPAPGQIVR